VGQQTGLNWVHCHSEQLGADTVDGYEAYGLVRAYSGFGVHRTGMPGDDQTVHWLARALSLSGAEVELRPYRFNQFDATAAVELRGRSVEAMPLHYSATGQSESINPAVAEINAHDDDELLSLELRQIKDRVKENNDGLILVTRCPTDALCAINRSEHDFLDFPAILVPGSEHKEMGAERPISHFEASIGVGQSSNVIARFPSSVRRRSAIVTTPLSGWFSCAGERGCGIALALHVAGHLCRYLPVTLLATTGHELGFLGGYELGKGFDEDPELIVHIGACIANRATELTAVCSASNAAVENISSSLTRIGAHLRMPRDPSDPRSWIGESKCWAFRNRPMLSVAGLAPQFHTPGDLPEVATSPHLLQEAIEAISEAACALVVSVLA
jgi:hypothetical protein